MTRPEWIEVTKYAAPGNFMLGEIGRIDDVVFIETTQITNARSTTDVDRPVASRTRRSRRPRATDPGPYPGWRMATDSLGARGGASAAGHHAAVLDATTGVPDTPTSLVVRQPAVVHAGLG